MVCVSRFFLSVRGATRRFYCAFLTDGEVMFAGDEARRHTEFTSAFRLTSSRGPTSPSVSMLGFFACACASGRRSTARARIANRRTIHSSLCARLRMVGVFIAGL